MVVVPAATAVTRPVIGLTVATDRSLLVYVNAPKLLEVGYEGVKAASKKVLEEIVKTPLLLKVGAIGLIVTLASTYALA